MFPNLSLFNIVLLCCLNLWVLLEANAVNTSGKSKIVSRNKRYVAFPEGASFSTAGCVTVGVIGQPAPHTSPGTFSWGMNWAIAYELPNTTETAAYYHLYKRKLYKPQAVLKRKYRRDLYNKLETILDNMGYTGRECILKTICETGQRLIPRGDNMIEEMFRTLFTMPPTKVLPIEPMEHSIYDAAHRLGRILDGCDRYKCAISLIDLMKGYYNAPSQNVDYGRNPWTLFSSAFGSQ